MDSEVKLRASLKDMLDLRQATQDGRVTEKHELEILRDAREALATPPPATPDPANAVWMAVLPFVPPERRDAAWCALAKVAAPAAPAGWMVLVQHGEAGDPATYSWCRGADSLRVAVEEACWMNFDPKDGSAVTERDEIIADLMKRGRFDFEGDPPLELLSPPETPAAPDEAMVRDAMRWRAYVASGRPGAASSHVCRACGHRYTPMPGESEDCPLCGNDGTNDQPAALTGEKA